MSSTERYAWASLLVWLVALVFLFTRFTTGVEIFGNSLGLAIVEQPAARLCGTYVSLTIFVIVLESIVASVTAVTGRAGKVERDERDDAIQARANLASYWFMAAALNVIVIQVLASAAYGGAWNEQLNLTSTSGMAFALLVVLIGAEIVKRVALIWNYRAA
jgi:hypothetical protein